MTTSSPSAQRAGSATAARVNQSRLYAIGLMCLALAALSCLDCSAKWLGIHRIPIVEVIFARYFVAFIVIAVTLNPWRTPDAWQSPRLWLQTFRALALIGSTLANFMAFRTMQLSEIIAISFSLPLVIALLAGPVLGERIGLKQWVAITVGFAGILIVTQPGAAALNPAVLWCFTGVACNTFYQLATRKLSGVASTGSMMVISTGLATVLVAPLLPVAWAAPQSPLEWLVLLIPGAFGALGHYLLVRAYTLAPAPIVAPFSYVQIISSSLLGLIVFGEMPGTATVIGAIIVISSGLYLIYLETRGQKIGPANTTAPAE